jgi:hypothetical protein
MRSKSLALVAVAALFLPTIAHAEGRGIFHRDDLLNARDDVKANSKPVPPDPNKVEPFSKLNATARIDMYPGTVVSWHLPEHQRFKTIVDGDENIAATHVENDSEVFVHAKPDITGHTNFLALDEEGTVVANVLVRVLPSNMRRDEGRVDIHNKKELAGFKLYKCYKDCEHVSFDDTKVLSNESSSAPAETTRRP